MIAQANPPTRPNRRHTSDSLSLYVKDSLEKSRSKGGKENACVWSKRSTVVTECGKKLRVFETDASHSGEDVPLSSRWTKELKMVKPGAGNGRVASSSDDDQTGGLSWLVPARCSR
eukprot:765911-Hanusia_phi.AAC.3